MTRATAILLALLVVLGTAPAATADETDSAAAGKAAQVEPDDPPVVDSAGEVIPGEVIVEFTTEEQASAAASNHGLEVVADLGTPGEAGEAAMAGEAGKPAPTLVSTGGRPVEEVVAELAADPAVVHAEPNYVVQVVNDGTVAAVPVNDPMTGDQYSLNQMRVRDAWSLSTGGNNVVAVLDTGVQFSHPDLAGRVVSGYDFVNDDADATDDNGHGTWVASIIAANANDGYGMAGVSWSDKILPVKVMNREGTGSTADLLAGIRWSADRGADVINMSVGGFPWSQLMQDAVNYAWGKGAVLVGAAGNNRRHENFYPASFDNVISVSATQTNDEFSNWSSWGPKVDVSAPGSAVMVANCYTCTYGGHDTWGTHMLISGTSFATPNVAGVVALMRARYPSSSPQQIVDRLLGTVDDLGFPGFDVKYGRGRVNVYRALGASVSGPGPTIGADGVEPNNVLTAPRPIGFGTIHPSIHPAGDVDVFAIDLPSPGTLTVSALGVVDNRPYPWHKTGLPIDPIIEIYDASHSLLQRVDNQWEATAETTSLTVAGPVRVLIRISNWYANGNTRGYALTTTFRDAVPPTVVSRSPGPGAVNVAYDGAAVSVAFNEAVTGVSGSTFRMLAPGGAAVAARVSHSGAQATLTPSVELAAETTYTVSLTSGIRDGFGTALAPVSWTFTTGKSAPRLAGADRFATAAAVSAATFAPGVPVVYVATGADFPDALAGGPAARLHGGPLLLVKQTGVTNPTMVELQRLRPGRIVVLGGPGAVSDGVLAALRGYTSGSVTRISGADRFATAAAISKAGWADGSNLVYVATGANYPDALAAGAAGAHHRAPILLVGPDRIPASTLAELQRLGPDRIVVMGGSSVVSDGVVAALRAIAATVDRIAGADRYATAAMLSAATHAANGVSHVYIATGRSFPDGLAIGPVAGLRGGPLLLLPGSRLPASVAAELRRLDPTHVVFVGGTAVLSEGLRSAVRAIWQ